MKKQLVEWIPEKEAAAMMGLSPKYFRRCVREGKILGINYTRLNYKTYEYNKPDIEAYKLRNSTMPNYE